MTRRSGTPALYWHFLAITALVSAAAIGVLPGVL